VLADGHRESETLVTLFAKKFVNRHMGRSGLVNQNIGWNGEVRIARFQSGQLRLRCRITAAHAPRTPTSIAIRVLVERTTGAKKCTHKSAGVAFGESHRTHKRIGRAVASTRDANDDGAGGMGYIRVLSTAPISESSASPANRLSKILNRISKTFRITRLVTIEEYVHKKLPGTS
jgi:hypothetical protein